MAVAHVNGISLWYEELGAGEPLVVVHGSWFDHEDWRTVAERLSGRFHVLLYDRRGHSRSQSTPGEGGFAVEAADLAELLGRLGHAPAHVVGHSTGAVVALLLAASRPELVRSLILHEAPVFELLAGDEEAGPLLATLGAALAFVGEMIALGEYEAAARTFADDVALGPGVWQHELPADTRATMTANAPSFLDSLRHPARLAIDLNALATFNQPVLLTEGSDSFRLRALANERLMAAFSHVERRVLPGVAHLPELTDPNGYARMVAEFAGPPLPS